MIVGMLGSLTWSLTFGPLVAAIAVIVSAAVVARTAGRELQVQRQLQSTERFLELLAVAHGRPRDGREGVGVSEQVAAVHLVAEFGSDHSWLRMAATKGVASMATWLNEESDPALQEAVHEALTRLNGDARATSGAIADQ